MDNITFNEIEKEKAKACEHSEKPCKILTAISTLIFGASLIYGIIALTKQTMEASQATLIIIESILGAIIPLAYVILNKLFKIRVNFLLQFFIFIFALLGIVFGETFHFYYLIPYWDKILHTVSGFGITFIGFSLCYAYLGKNEAISNKVLLSIIFAFLFSLAFSVIWEFYEFSVDSIFGLNMQKVMPTNNLFNGGDTHLILEGTDSEIAEFYRTPEGYRYALVDTMTDLLLNFTGTCIMTLIFHLSFKHNKANAFSNAITLEK